MFGDVLGWHPRAKEPGHRSRIDILADEELSFLAVYVALRMRRAVPEFFVDPLSPHPRGFDEM
jgi:hypothetical protein